MPTPSDWLLVTWSPGVTREQAETLLRGVPGVQDWPVEPGLPEKVPLTRGMLSRAERILERRPEVQSVTRAR